MSSLRGVTIALVPIFVLGTMAVGLRLGAEPPGLAAHVIPMSAPAARDRLVWQVRVFREARRIREPGAQIAIDVDAKIAAKGRAASARAVTNDDGIAEVDLPLPSTPGDIVDVEVRGAGIVLAQGSARVPDAEPSRAPAPLRATKVDGNVAIDVFAPPGGIAPSLPSAIRVRLHAPAQMPASALALSVEGEAGLEAPSGTVSTCTRGPLAGSATSLLVVPVRAMGHVLGLRLEAKTKDATASADAGAEAGARGTWFGALPVVPGGDDVTIEPERPQAGAPFTLRVRSPTSKPMVYVEVFDDVGREVAAPLTLTAKDGLREATMQVRGLPPGRHFAIASSRAEGFDLGTAIARPLLVGDADGAPTCEAELDLWGRQPPRHTREVAIDGFTLRREEAARIRRKGMSLAIASLTVGALLAAVMLLAPLRKKPASESPEIEGLTKTAMPRWAIAAMLLGLSCLAYLLLAGLVLYSGN